MELNKTSHVIDGDAIERDVRAKHYEAVHNLSLHQFTSKDIVNKMKEWVYNDINYKNHLFQTKKILVTHSLSGEVISSQPTNNAKLIVQNYLLTFLTAETLDIMFDCFDEYKKKYSQLIKPKEPEEIAEILFHFPLHNLTQRILSENIDGTKFINSLKDRRYDMIKEETGWRDSEVYQIESVLLRHHTFTPSEFKQNMEYVFMHRFKTSLSKTIKDKIQNMLSQFDIEQLHFQIKNAQNIDKFSDAIINMIDEWMQHNTIKAEDVSTIYQAIAECFMFNHDLVENDDLSLEERQHFVCNNCGNCNINSFINSRVNIDLSMCALCSLKQRDSIILKLRNQKTFIMVNDVDESTACTTKQEDTTIDDIDSLIQTAAEHGSFSLICPNRTDNMQCPSIIRLARMLIVYKRWIHAIYQKTNGNDAIDKTTQVDVAKFVNKDILRSGLIESCACIKGIRSTDSDALLRLFDDNVDDIQNVETFLNMKRKIWILFCKKHCDIRPSCACKLRFKTLKYLKKEAQTQQFGAFLSDLDLDAVNRDYYHILKVHINNGNKITIKNTFRFFEKVVHFEDTQKQIENCRSTKRRERRVNDLSSIQTDDDVRMDSTHKNIWKLKQFYNQTQLDMIHSFLVHSNWQYFVKRYTQQNEPNADNDDNYEHMQSMNEEEIQNKGKYMTDSNESNADNYGFGIEHCHPHLSPNYCSIHDELVCNKLCPLSERCFQNLLIKAIKLHTIASTTDFNKELICKYFNLQFNIIRNELIGLRHLFAIIIYTDISSFCTTFRATYRMMNNESTADQVTRRHKELYHYSRCLFEAIEFFGQYMEPDLKVYHGLNRVMHFSQFTAYFHQPISTTVSLATACQFADGRGIILTLSSATEYFGDSTKTPKYLSVSWLSCFPNEDEKLFYGAYVVFQITNIIEAESLKGHSKELLMLNKFQKTVQNQTVHWDVKHSSDKKKIEALVILIQHLMQNKNKQDTKQEIKGKKSKYITKYGKALFHYFCVNSKTTWICIRNYKLLPGPLQNVLFYESDANASAVTKKQRQRISLLPLTNLFPNLTEIVLNELDLQQMTADSKTYVQIVLEYIKTSTVQIERVIFKSQQQRDRKENSTLKNLVDKYASAYAKHHWTFKYQFLMENTHNLTFTNNKALEIISMTSVKSDTESVDVDHAIDVQFSFSLRSSTNNLLPSYFLQITSIDEDGFHIELISDRLSDTKRKFFIKEMNCKPHIRSIERRIKIEAGATKGGIDVDIHEDHDETHYLALYKDRKAAEAVTNSMQMKFIVFKGVIDVNYAPHCMDINTVLKEKHESKHRWDIYWLLPSKSFGEISYKIVKDDMDSKQSKEEIAIITSLPYSVPFAITPLSFQVITITTIGGYIYESIPSQSISIEAMLPSIDAVTVPLSSWLCSVCTYTNDHASTKCNMCGLPPKNNVAIPMRADASQSVASHTWMCSTCTYSNPENVMNCMVCSSLKKATEEEDEQMFDDTDKSHANISWMCNVCTLMNSGTHERCQACNSERPDINTNEMTEMNQMAPVGMNDATMNLLSHGMSAKNVFQMGTNQGISPMEQKYDPYPNLPSMNYTSPMNMNSMGINSMNMMNNLGSMNLNSMNMNNSMNANSMNMSAMDNASFENQNIAESTVEDFNRAASDIACYNNDPSAIFGTLKSLTKKLLKDDVRYRTLDTTNPKVGERLLGFEGVLDFLMLLGFESDAMGMKLICNEKPSKSVVQNAISVLDSYRDQFAAKEISKTTKHKDLDTTSVTAVSGMIEEEEEEEKEDDGRLSLQQIILWITTSQKRDNQTLDTLIMTYTLFTDSISLMKALKERFFAAIPDDILNIKDAKQREAQIQQYQKTVQKRLQLVVIKVVRDWMRHYYRQDFEGNKALQSELQQWLEEIAAFSQKDINKDASWIMLLHQTVKTEFEKAQQRNWQLERQKELNISLLYKDVKLKPQQMENILHKAAPQQLADQLTLMDERLFLLIEAREYVEKQWKVKDSQVAEADVALLILIKQFNALQSMVSIEILRAKSVTKRTQTIKRFIKVCARLRETNNYHSLCAIFTALNSSPIHRLKIAWRKVSDKSMKLHQEHTLIFSTSANHRNLRTLLRQSKGACIPHLGLCLQDFIFISEQRSDASEKGVSFNKCVRFADRVNQLRGYQQHKYSMVLKEDKKIQKALFNQLERVNDITEDDLYDMSTEIKKADEKSGRNALFHHT